MSRKISPDHEHQLVQIFLHMGQQVVAPMCAELGLSSSYARSRAYEFGYLPSRKAKLAVIKKPDHRWKWAKERGSVVA